MVIFVLLVLVLFSLCLIGAQLNEVLEELRKK